MDAGTALAPGAVSRIDPRGKYLIFFSNKGREAMADHVWRGHSSRRWEMSATTTPYAREDLAALAAQQLNALARKVHRPGWA